MNSGLFLAHYEKVADAPDAVSRLRRFVLDLAVRGKLAEQDRADEPASELLRCVGKEKSRLGINQAISPLEETEIPFELPDGWSWTRIGELCSKTGSGSTPRGGKEVYKDHGVPFLRSQNIYDDGLRLSDVVYIDTETHGRMRGTKVLPGDLLLNITGGSIGRCCRVPNEFAEANVSQHVAIIRCAAKGAEAFLHRLVQSPYFQVFVLNEQTGAGRGGLPKNRMDKIPVALPPLAEQRRIVVKVDELMALCDELEAARAKREATRDRLTTASLARLTAPDVDAETFRTHARFTLDALPALTARKEPLEQLRRSIRFLAVQGKLSAGSPKFDRSSDLPSIESYTDRLTMSLPRHWRWARVDEVAESRLGKMLDKAKNRGEPFPYLRNTNVHWFDIRTEDIKTIRLERRELEEYRLLAGDVLICEGGHGIGRAAVWSGSHDNMVFQKALHRVRPGGDLDSHFFALCCFVYFQAGVMQTYFTGVGIPHFTGRALARLVFPLPPIAEQRRIVSTVDELVALCDQLEGSLASADTARQRLLETILHEAIEPAAQTLEAAE